MATAQCVCAAQLSCRCLQIDCWDGPDMEPVVYHGYTLTTKIHFRDVANTVEQHAFQVTADSVTWYKPCSVVESQESNQVQVVGYRERFLLGVMLCLTDICLAGDSVSQEQQEVMAKYLISILRDKRLRAPLAHSTTGDLPSPKRKSQTTRTCRSG